MRVRIDRDVAKKVKAAMKKSGRSAAREVSMALAAYYERQDIKDFLTQPPIPNQTNYSP